ncbi:uroporphyrinogen-III synthase [Rhodovulum sulfidophilum]|uniref:uroporphyrinogen-III synthase n=1 Tax=Rhodovulum sulfidophilum TaxID=35806 RepID=UPI0019243438|nr:uroporphyrinogen-III synthase [Rhodovulum sulfidophilum]MBL3573898.1 uroporphyrinogen-III synthase [Rhodovulum sulfidophilum]MCE8430026.1 uroporphyrinogen-III synthase [Rhodovulum sulfidophilum]MCF4118425.1 uroporphyrinogen-III synthase [Rhodovulum sulfidophilum]
MTQHPPLLLLTRPRLQSARFAGDFVKRFGSGIAIRTAPVLDIVPRPDPVSLDGFAGLLFTSENGVAALAAVNERRDLPAYCVGERTADAARSVGFRATAAEGTAASMIAHFSADPPKGPLLHLRGEHARVELAEALSAIGIPTEERIVYAQEALPFPSGIAAEIEAAPLTLLPLFSPRSALLVAEWLRGLGGRFALVTMSAAVTASWDGPRPEVLIEAERPDAPAMMDGLAAVMGAVGVP